MVNSYKIFVRYVGAHFDSAENGNGFKLCLISDYTQIMFNHAALFMPFKANDSIYR